MFIVHCYSHKIHKQIKVNKTKLWLNCMFYPINLCEVVLKREMKSLLMAKMVKKCEFSNNFAIIWSWQYLLWQKQLSAGCCCNFCCCWLVSWVSYLVRKWQNDDKEKNLKTFLYVLENFPQNSFKNSSAKKYYYRRIHNI